MAFILPIQSTGSRLIQLDVVRCVAVVLVLMNHTFFLDLTVEARQALRYLVPLFRAGDIGVPIFFVLSGFLIGGLLLQEIAKTGTVRPGRFLVRRGFKIYPPFYLVVGLYAAYLHWFEGSLNMERLLRELFFVQNYGIGGFLDVSWSLAVEEHFYLLFILLVMVLLRREAKDGGGVEKAVRVLRPVVAIALVLMAVCWALRCAAFLPLSVEEIAKRSPTLQTHFRIDALFAGAALAWARFAGWRPGWLARPGVRWLALVGVIGVFALNGIPSSNLSLHFKKTHYLVMLTVASGVLLWLALDWKPGNRGLWRVMGWIGRNSYGIYLVHVPFYRFLNKTPVTAWAQGLPAWLWVLLAWAAATGVGILMTRLIEVPALRLRARLCPPS